MYVVVGACMHTCDGAFVYVCVHARMYVVRCVYVCIHAMMYVVGACMYAYVQ
jgi:hypothetical protein